MAKGKLESLHGTLFVWGHAEAEPLEDQSARHAADAGGIRRRDGGSPAGDLRLRVLHQEPASPGVRQSAQGAAHLRQGGRRQRPRRLRGSRDPPRRGRQGGGRRQRRTSAPSEPGEPLPDHRHRQRPRNHPPADSTDIREAPVWVQVPSAAHEPRPAGHGDLGGRHVWTAHDRQARADHLPHECAGARPLLRSPDRYQEERAADSREEADRLGISAWHPGDDGSRGPLPEGASLGRRVHRADHHR